MAKNILLITSDQQHWNTFGCDFPEVKTPAFDKLISEGTLYTRAYCPNPTCTPSRGSIITGKYPSQHGGWTLGTKVHEAEPTIGDYLHKAGYATALVGKAHFQQLTTTDEFPSIESYPIMQDLDFWRDFDDPFYGFRHVELARNHADEGHVGQHYAIWMEEKGLPDWRDHFQEPGGNHPRQYGRWTIPEEFHYNTWIAERSIALLDEYAADDKPFFLWASFFDPHPPYLIPAPFDTMYDPADMTVPEKDPEEYNYLSETFKMTQTEKPDFSPWQEPGGNSMHGYSSHLHDRDKLAQDIAIYYGMVSCLDKYVGKIVDRLDELGLAEDTLVVYTTDHGHFYGHHGLTAKGGFHFEDMLRLPFIVRQPGTVPAGQRSDSLQSLVDLTPSFLAALGEDIPGDMTGVNQFPVWSGQQDHVREHVVCEFRHQPTTINVRTYVDSRTKLTVHFNRPYGELFDLVADPGEIRNQWDNPEYREIRNDTMLRFLLAEIGKEEPLTEASVELPMKSRDAYTKTIDADGWRLTVDPANDVWELLEDGSETNQWDNPTFADTRADLVHQLIFKRMAGEPLWMPRVAHA